MKTIPACIWVTWACVSAAFAQENYSQQWSYFKNVSINTTPSGADVVHNVTKFPLLVRLSSVNSDVFSGALATGADIRFSKSNGTTPLHYQIERWDSAGRAAEIWVLMDTVFGNNSTQSIRMYWGKKGAPDSSSGPGVFESSNGFVAVWHLADSGGTNVGGYRDATSYHHNGTGVNMTGASTVAGTIGKASNFSGTQYIAVPSSDALNISYSITVSAWFLSKDWNGNNRILEKGNADNQYCLRNELQQFEWKVDGTFGGPILQIIQPSTGVWHLVHATYDYDYGYTDIFIDGTLRGSQSTTGTIGTGTITDYLSIGGKPGTVAPADYFNGIMDEVRVQNKTRDFDWYRLDYGTQNPGSTAVTLGPTQVPSSIHSISLRSRKGMIKSAWFHLIDLRGRMVDAMGKHIPPPR